MLTSWENYKVKNGTWEDLAQKVESLGKLEEPNTDGSNLYRNILLNDRYFCNLALSHDEKELQAFYIGVDKDTGKNLLEKELGFELDLC